MDVKSTSNVVRFTIKERKALKKRAWTVFSLFIRKRDNFTCVTCGKTRDTLNKKGKKTVMFGGHYCHNRQDFNERNINTQCYTCNFRRKGNMRVYTIYLIDKYGLDYVKDLLLCEKEKPVLESAQYYLSIIKKYECS